MEVTKTLLAGKSGTKRYLREYGDNLYCVRYRQDKEKGRRYTTVELIKAVYHCRVNQGGIPL